MKTRIDLLNGDQKSLLCDCSGLQVDIDLFGCFLCGEVEIESISLLVITEEGF